ncbi:hypothetical protein ACFPOI_29065 [Nonomuraea angiospora]|uniref:Secreted protein n=1 Tax=Nonomuraea angiospora TaxID=46172 RepID=A0ABR9LTX9_9ACTN|nr:hypothetical protein [Nonomuraea angiospora]MBE1584118.1 hypothetical protein [Nonomuraea angiospora]
MAHMKCGYRRICRASLIWLLIPAMLVGCDRKNRDAASHHPSTSQHEITSSAEPRNSSGGDEPGITIEVPIEVGGDSDNSKQDSGSDNSERDSGSDNSERDSGSEQNSEAEEPEPDPTEDAFRSVSAGDCLPIYRTGYSDDWSQPKPPEPVSCRGNYAGLFYVTRTGGSGLICPNGRAEDSWRYYSAMSRQTTTLCLRRIWVKNYCVLAIDSGNQSLSFGLSTAVGCNADRVPKPYNRIMVVSDVYRAPPDAHVGYCKKNQYDNRMYWMVLVSGGEDMVCFTDPNT